MMRMNGDPRRRRLLLLLLNSDIDIVLLICQGRNMNTKNLQIGDRISLNSLKVFSDGTVVALHERPDSVMVVWDKPGGRAVRVLCKDVRLKAASDAD